jgi:uncharacterized protein (TIGR00645 family)
MSVNKPPPPPPPPPAPHLTYVGGAGLSYGDFNLVDAIGEMIFSIRWGLVPMYLLMWVAVVSYVLWFGQEIFSFWFALYDDAPHQFAVGPWHPHFLLHNGEDFIVWSLGLIDASMVANLIVMTTVGGYSTFVKEFDIKALNGRPRWMNRLDSSTLKIKMAVSLIGITAILILRTSMGKCSAAISTISVVFGSWVST